MRDVLPAGAEFATTDPSGHIYVWVINRNGVPTPKDADA